MDMMRHRDVMLASLSVTCLLHALTVCGWDLNCVQLPPMKELANCCRFPEIKLEAFANKCQSEAQKSSLFGLSGYYNHCAIACIFNASHILQPNGDVNLQRMQTLLGRLMQERAFVLAYLSGFRSCVPLVRQKIARRPKWPLFGRSNCSKVPLMLALCAHSEVFVNCPAYAWTRSAQCNRTREYLRSCGLKY